MQSDWSIARYTPDELPLWDSMVESSRQGTMLHLRGYMDYHSDRFSDCSLIAYKKGKPMAILPANLSCDGSLWSHQGLTYGGWLTPRAHFDGNDMLDLFDEWLGWCRGHRINTVYYKTVPHIYHRIPAEEDIYALFRYGATPWMTNLSSTIDMREPMGFNTLQRRHLKKASMRDLRIRETRDAGEFMPVLERCLMERHGSMPVHSAAELQALKDKFDNGVRLFLCEEGEAIEAEVCIFDTAGVAHCQYIATSESGRENGALTYLLHYLITQVFNRRRYFDFGTSNEMGGMWLNAGLIRQKVGLGGRGIACQCFKMNI